MPPQTLQSFLLRINPTLPETRSTKAQNVFACLDFIHFDLLEFDSSGVSRDEFKQSGFGLEEMALQEHRTITTVFWRIRIDTKHIIFH